MAVPTVSRDDVLWFRFRRHQLDREPDAASTPTDAALLDYGVQDTGPDGAAWALAVRGTPSAGPDDLAFAWTLRGAPHAYDRSALPAIAVATAPLSEADAAKRIYDAAKSLKAAGVPSLKGLRAVAERQRDIVTQSMVKGELSSRLTGVLEEPYLRFCRSCDAMHAYEMLFRLPPLQAGLELEAGTSPPLLRRVPGMDPPLYAHLADEAEPRFDVIRNYLRFYGPARPQDAAAFLDAPLKDVKAHWPSDVNEVVVGEVDVGDGPSAKSSARRSILTEDLGLLLSSLGSGAAGSDHRTVRLVGPYDAYLQLRDRELLVPDEARRKDLWRVLGRPGAILADGAVIGTWRPRGSGRKLVVRVESWHRLDAPDRAAVEREAERLADHRGVTLAGIEDN
jgi:hypothetical protein